MRPLYVHAANVTPGATSTSRSIAVSSPLAQRPAAGEGGRRAPVEVPQDLVGVEPVGDVVDRAAVAEVGVPAVVAAVRRAVPRTVLMRGLGGLSGVVPGVAVGDGGMQRSRRATERGDRGGEERAATSGA